MIKHLKLVFIFSLLLTSMTNVRAASSNIQEQSSYFDQLLKIKNEQLNKLLADEKILKDQIAKIQELKGAVSKQSHTTNGTPSVSTIATVPGTIPATRTSTGGATQLTCPDDYMAHTPGGTLGDTTVCVPRPKTASNKTITPGNVPIPMQKTTAGGSSCPAGYSLSSRIPGSIMCEPNITEVSPGVFSCLYVDEVPVPDGKTGLMKCVSPYSNTNTSGTKPTLSCAGGTNVIKSADGSGACNCNWSAANAGESAVGNCTNGGSITGICSASGTWDSVVASCPSAAASLKCPAGSNEIPSASGGKSCTCHWGETPSSSMGQGGCTNGGTITALCNSHGAWVDVAGACP